MVVIVTLISSRECIFGQTTAKVTFTRGPSQAYTFFKNLLMNRQVKQPEISPAAYQANNQSEAKPTSSTL